ncbi:MAG: hypothetical protein U0836_12935 [Pirellulales bacterium]
MSAYLAVVTLVHVVISVVALGAGGYVLYGLLRNERLDRATALFLATTVATSATGFLFPFQRWLPSHTLAVISLVALGVAIYARYGRPFVGGWVKAYVATAVLSLYLNVFVLVVQAFLKVPALKALAPKQNEPPFVVAQLIVLAVFLGLGALAFKRFRG